jgi:hypothetical protein
VGQLSNLAIRIFLGLTSSNKRLAVTSLLCIAVVRLWSSILQVCIFIERDKIEQQSDCTLETEMFVPDAFVK